MSNYSEKNYSEFFKEDLYGGFVDYLIDKYGVKHCLNILRDDQLVTKKGVHPSFKEDFNKFMVLNPLIAKEHKRNFGKFIQLRNIAGEPLRFPIDTQDEMVMVQQKIRVPEFIPVKDDITRASKGIRKTAAPMKGQILKGEWHGRKYVHPKRLMVHFKEGFAKKLGKTTLCFMVDSRSEAMQILLDRFENKVAYATIQNEEEFCFVKPRNGKKKRNRKLRG